MVVVFEKSLVYDCPPRQHREGTTEHDMNARVNVCVKAHWQGVQSIPDTHRLYLACLAVRAHIFGADSVRHRAAHFGIVNTYSQASCGSLG
jgi:hypothetical protein